MPCTTYETMCELCKYHFKLMREKGNSADMLEYRPDTYPIVFKCMFQLPAGVEALAQEHSATFLPTIHARLRQRFHTAILAYCDHEVYQPAPGGPILIRISLLVDFPCKNMGDDGFNEFLKATITLGRELEDWTTRIEVEDGLKDCLFRGSGAGPDNWEAYVASQQDHLCLSRLGWFLKREGLVPYF
ncbi:hypothetical protein BDV12DRAFT_193955 [Aspergillus spectabilis]